MRWRQAGPSLRRLGSFRELFGDRRWAKSAVLGVLLTAVGLGTTWSVTVDGQDLAYNLLVRLGVVG